LHLIIQTYEIPASQFKIPFKIKIIWWQLNILRKATASLAHAHATQTRVAY